MQSSAFGPFRIALVGDFSARTSRGIVDAGRALAQRKAIRIDRDSLDDAITRLAPIVRLRALDTEISFATLDGFHPDNLYQRLPRLRALRDARVRDLVVPSLIAAGQSQSLTPTPSDALAAILGETPLPPGGAALHVSAKTLPPPTTSSDGLTEFVRHALAPHLIATRSPSEAALEAGIDAAIAVELRSILHDADFQALESAWRSVDFLARRLETDGALQLYLIDISREELAHDLLTQPIEESGVFHVLVDGSVGTPGADPWALIAGLFTLGDNADDLALAAKLGQVARAAGAAFVAGGSPALAGTPSFATEPDPSEWSQPPEEWDTLRSSPVAPYLAFVVPRVLLRLPYGKSDECELVKLEECKPDGELPHESYLWGSGSVVAVLAIGEGFTQAGWSLRPSRQITKLPLYIYRVGGETMATPCAEVVLTERAAERLLDAGLTPLLTVRDTDEVILPRLQSIARPPTRLMGRWTAASHVSSQ
jgi:type VI secretion system protein ImpC